MSSAVPSTHLDKVELEHELHRLPHLVLEAMELEAVALEDGFGSGGDADVTEDRRNLRRVEARRRHEDVESDGEKPERCDVKLAGLREPAVSTWSLARDTEMTYESHDRTNRPLDVDAVISVNRNEAGLAPDRRKVDKGPVVVHDLLDVLEAVGEHPVELARQDGRVARDDAFTLRRRATTSSQSRLHPKDTNIRLTLCNETWKSMSRARCTPKNSPVIKIRFCFARRLRFFWPMTPDSGVGK